MSYIDSELSELFPSINLDSMGCIRDPPIDEISKNSKTKEPHPFIAFPDDDLVSREFGVQGHGFFESLKDCSFSELLDDCGSLVNLDTDNFDPNRKSQNCASPQKIGWHITADPPRVGNVLSSINERTSSECKKIDPHALDSLDTLENDGLCSEYVTFESILGEPRECLSSLMDDALPLDSAAQKKVYPSSVSSSADDASTPSKVNDECLHSSADENSINSVSQCVFNSHLTDSPNSTSSSIHLNTTLTAGCSPLQTINRKELKILPYPTDFVCAVCSPKVFFPSKESLRSHEESHVKGKQRSFKCKECESVFKNSRNFTNHLRKHKKRMCQTCLKEFPENSFKNHLACHDLSARLVCEFCGLDFTSKIKLFEHQSVHSGINPYTCDLCGQGFKSHGSYWVHRKYHESLRPFKCDLCGQSFRRTSALAKHRRSNCLNDIAGEVLKNSASVTYEVKTTYSKNFKIITSKLQRLHKCQFCSKTFPTTTSLEIHIRKHTNERPFQCERCSKTFPTKNSLTKHSKNVSACSRHRRRMLLHKIPDHSVLQLKMLPKLGTNTTALLSQ